MCAGEDRVQQQPGQVRGWREAEEFLKDEGVDVVAPEVVEGATFVGVKHGGTRFVHKPVARLDGGLTPPEIFPKTRPFEGDALPHRASNARADVIEDGERASRGRRKRRVGFRAADELFSTFQARIRARVNGLLSGRGIWRPYTPATVSSASRSSTIDASQ